MRFTQRKGRCVQVSFDDGKTWKSTGCSSIAEARLKFSNTKRSTKLSEFSKGFYDANVVGSKRWRDVKQGVEFTETTYIQKDMILNSVIIPKWGEYSFQDINALMVDDWILYMDVSNSYKTSILTVMKELFNLACINGLCNNNPIKEIKVVQKKTKRDIYIEKEQLDKLFPKDDEQLIKIWGTPSYACFFLIMKETGFRPSEVKGLSKSNIDFSEKKIFTDQIFAEHERKIVKRIKTTNSGKKFKVGYISDQTLRLVMMIKQTQLFYTNQVYYSRKNKENINSYYGVFTRVTKEVLGKQYPPYSLRHTFMTNLIGKMPKEIIMELMGHTQWEDCYDNRTKEAIIEQSFNLIAPYRKLI